MTRKVRQQRTTPTHILTLIWRRKRMYTSCNLRFFLFWKGTLVIIVWEKRLRVAVTRALRTHGRKVFHTSKLIRYFYPVINCTIIIIYMKDNFVALKCFVSCFFAVLFSFVDFSFYLKQFGSPTSNTDSKAYTLTDTILPQQQIHLRTYRSFICKFLMDLKFSANKS